MFNKKTLLCLIAWSSILSFASAQQCSKCMERNNAYCYDDKTFYFCPDGVNPSTSGGLMRCEGETHCTDDLAICADASVAGPCQSSTKCGECGTNSGFICVSKTEYAFCMNGNPIKAPCDDGQLCSQELYDTNLKPKKICAPESILKFLNLPVTCDGVSTPAPTTTTVSPTVLSQACVTAENAGVNTANARYFYIHNPTDINCHTYIYCEKANNVMQGILFTCPNNGFWDKTTKKCQTTKPASCTTTTQAITASTTESATESTIA